MYASLWKIGLETTLLAVKAQQSVAQRLTKAMLGCSSGISEAGHTAVERALAAGDPAVTAITAVSESPSHDVVRGYRRKVRVSKKRLSKP